MSYNRLNGLHRGSRIIQQGCVGVAEDVGRGPVEVDCATDTAAISGLYGAAQGKVGCGV